MPVGEASSAFPGADVQRSVYRGQLFAPHSGCTISLLPGSRHRGRSLWNVPSHISGPFHRGDMFPSEGTLLKRPGPIWLVVRHSSLLLTASSAAFSDHAWERMDEAKLQSPRSSIQSCQLKPVEWHKRSFPVWNGLVRKWGEPTWAHQGVRRQAGLMLVWLERARCIEDPMIVFPCDHGDFASAGGTLAYFWGAV